MKEKIITYYKKAYSFISAHKILSVIFLVALIGGGYYFTSKKAVAAVTYQFTRVQKGDISSTISATGQVTPNSQVDLKPKVNANVTAVYVKSGDRVKSGQVLFRLDATDAYKQVRDAQASLDSAKLSLLKLKSPQAIDLLSIQNSLAQENANKKNQDTKVTNAYNNLLSSGLQVLPQVSYTTETAPTLTGSYNGNVEGQIKITVYQGGSTGYSFSYSGIANGTGDVNTIVAQPIGDTGLYIKWNSSIPQTNWVINIPNTQSSSYLSNYTSWQNAIKDRDAANQASDRNIESLNQKLKDLTPGDDNLDVQSAKLQVTQRENALLDARTNLSNYVITAPFDGVMASVSVDIGSSAVMASANSSSALGTIVTDKKLAQITLNESDIVKVHLGQKAKVTFDAIDEGLTVDGTVVEITTLGTVTSGVVTYKVKVAFDSNDARILPNMSVSVDIINDSKTNVLYIPTQALKSNANGYYVEVPDGNVSVGGGNFASSTRRFGNASTTLSQSTATTSTSTRPIRTASSTFQRQGNASSSSNTNITVKQIPVTIGLQGDSTTEITSGLTDGEVIVLKKNTTTTVGASAAPSITSLFRPTSARAGASGNATFVRPQ